MKLSGDMTLKLVAGLALVGGGIYLLHRMRSGISAAVPQVVKDGFDATGQLVGLGFNMFRDPLDTFGVRPNENATWTPTVPWETNPAAKPDPVTGFVAPDQKLYTDPLVTDSGMDFRYF